MAEFHADGSLGAARLVAGGTEESIFQPSWSLDGLLYFISDCSNWWNIYSWNSDGNRRQITSLKAEFGLPQWVFGMSTYAFISAEQIVARYAQNGQHHLVKVDIRTNTITPIELPFSFFESVKSSSTEAYAIVGSPSKPLTLIELDLSNEHVHDIRHSSLSMPDPDYTSVPETIEFPTTENETSHAFFYPPANRDFRGPINEAPPLIVMIHGGPTSATNSVFSTKIQFWTTRGYAVCDLNYRGSTGFGRGYRNRLRAAWGRFDVADAAHAASYLGETGKADRHKLLIRGGSAGGYTTLAALTFHDVFVAGASHYGISDLSLLAEDTHKFESRYLNRLVGPYPEAKHIYDERSPIHHLEQFTSPVILFQGLEDKVVPPSQAEAILAALREKKVPVAYVPFAGEQHGFRKAENIIRCHEAELFFYGKVLGIRPADAIEPVEIHGL